MIDLLLMRRSNQAAGDNPPEPSSETEGETLIRGGKDGSLPQQASNLWVSVFQLVAILGTVIWATNLTSTKITTIDYKLEELTTKVNSLENPENTWRVHDMRMWVRLLESQNPTLKVPPPR